MYIDMGKAIGDGIYGVILSGAIDPKYFKKFTF
jgi:hypothetical protein